MCLLWEVVHPIRRHYTPSDRVQCDVTGAVPLVRSRGEQFVAASEAAVASLKSRSMSHQAVDDITEQAVEWVRLNLVLVEMDLPDVGR